MLLLQLLQNLLLLLLLLQNLLQKTAVGHHLLSDPLHPIRLMGTRNGSSRQELRVKRRLAIKATKATKATRAKVTKAGNAPEAKLVITAKPRDAVGAPNKILAEGEETKEGECVAGGEKVTGAQRVVTCDVAASPSICITLRPFFGTHGKKWGFLRKTPELGFGFRGFEKNGPEDPFFPGVTLHQKKKVIFRHETMMRHSAFVYVIFCLGMLTFSTCTAWLPSLFGGNSAMSLAKFALEESSYGAMLRVAERVRNVATELKREMGTASDSTDNDDFTLPQVVVIGEESSGKSSTLERVTGFSFFPMDKYQCTRMPVRLRLRYDPEGGVNQHVRITRAAIGASARSIAMPKLNFTVQRVGVANALRGIMEQTKDAMLAQRDVSETELVLDITGADVPSIDIVDLPGLVGASTDVERRGISDHTEKLALKYIKDTTQTSVFLAVFRGTQLRGGRGLKLLQDAGRLQRTIGVVTFLNQVVADEEFPDDPYHDIRLILQNQTSALHEYLPSLGGGYVGVIGRNSRKPSTAKLDPLREEHAETTWFNENLPQLGVTFGVKELVRRLDHTFKAPIQNEWIPAKLAAVDRLLQEANEQLKALGPDPGDIDLVRDVVNKVAQDPDGIKLAACRSAGKACTWDLECCSGKCKTHCVPEAHVPQRPTTSNVCPKSPSLYVWFDGDTARYELAVSKRYLKHASDAVAAPLRNLTSGIKKWYYHNLEISLDGIHAERFTGLNTALEGVLVDVLVETTQRFDVLVVEREIKSKWPDSYDMDPDQPGFVYKLDSAAICAHARKHFMVSVKRWALGAGTKFTLPPLRLTPEAQKAQRAATNRIKKTEELRQAILDLRTPTQ